MTIETLDFDQLSKVLHLHRNTIRSALCLRPERLPPCIRTAGGKPIWLKSTVEEWLKNREKESNFHNKNNTPTSNKRGRPTKAEQIQRKKIPSQAIDLEGGK